MPLKFGAATSDRVDCGKAATLNNLLTLTYVAWVYPTTLANARILGKGQGPHTQSVMDMSNSNGVLRYVRGAATTDSNCTSANFTFVLNRWQFVAATYDSGATPNIRLYWGSLLVPVAEVTYASQVNRVGTPFDDSANALDIGNVPDSAISSWKGSIAYAHVIGSVLALPSLRAIQTRSRNPFDAALGQWANTRGLWRPGRNGTGKVWDESGNSNHGTITGATPASDPSLPGLGIPRRSAA